jgi:hypothetical protein
MGNDNALCLTALSRPPPPAQPGQLILARMLPDITVEGYSSQIGHEESYIHDPSLMTSEWSTVWRPAVIIDVDWDELTQLYFFTAVAICRLAPECTASDTMVPFSTLFANDANAPSSIVLVGPEWALANYYCYVYKDPAKFYFLRSQVRKQVRGRPFCLSHYSSQSQLDGHSIHIVLIIFAQGSAQNMIYSDNTTCYILLIPTLGIARG